MSITSHEFILLFLPICFVVYMAKKRRCRMLMFLASLLFCGMANWSYSLILILSILFNYGCAKLLLDRPKKPILISAVICNTGLLFYCKYFNFFLESANGIFGTDFNLIHLFIPLGVSYYTFSQVSFLVECYKGKITQIEPLDYAVYITWFPKLLQGPIVYYEEFVRSLRRAEEKYEIDWLISGLQMLSIGLIKKLIIADTLAKAVNLGYQSVDLLTSTEAVFVSLAYTFQIYFDFSGYTDMAVGMSRMFGIDLIHNFNSPYKACSIPDFWNRWHISLTRFLRDYVYIPLGGNRKGKLRTYINIMIVFTVSGLWHGANITFVLWGIGHGIAQCAGKMLDKQWKRMHAVVQWLFTFSFVNVMWVFFRAENVGQALSIVKKMVALSGGGISEAINECFVLTEYQLLDRIPMFNMLHAQFAGQEMLIFIAIVFVICLNGKNCMEKKLDANLWSLFRTLLFLVWAILSMSSISTFVYADF